MKKGESPQYWIVAASALALTTIFIFQGFNYVDFLFGVTDRMSKIFVFNANKTVRFILNDIFAIFLIYGLFKERKYVLFACLVQAIGTVCILIPYLVMKTYYPAYNGPLISFLHRLVVNPLLLLVLIPAFVYQRRLQRS